ncbi:spore cortex biosynthesis protein YabQ [Peribacillus kribbensis]|uniref:spore cortex biosynthesis protein YabQ n=1 Tax=Peribacillus kribbensis TaxID=356658 RepID=UPI000415DF28|nr:spore cortex biosynthesis protein YabQ [Peribacillus kribbensis]
MTLTTQFYTLLSIVGMGCYFGAALDTYNLFLKRSKRNGFIVFVNDLLFWVVQGLLTFYILFLVNEGELRFYLFLALLCGFSIYQALLKKLYMRMLLILISIVKKMARIFMKIVILLLWSPLKWILFTAIAILLTIGRGLFSLAKLLLKPVLSIIKGLLISFSWLFTKIGRVLPKPVRSMLRRMEGAVRRFLSLIAGWVKRTKK